MGMTQQGDIVATGAISGASLFSGSASITNAMIVSPGSGGDFIAAAKIKPRLPVGTAQSDGTTATGEARLFSAYAAGSLVQLNISLDTVNTTTDTVVIDLLKSTAGGAYASVLSSTYTMNNSKTARTVYTVTPNTLPFVAGDIFKVTWTVTGTSAADLCITLYADCAPV